jgi:hypothetical protein
MAFSSSRHQELPGFNPEVVMCAGDSLGHLQGEAAARASAVFVSVV